MFSFLIMLAIFVMGNWFVLLLLYPVVRIVGDLVAPCCREACVLHYCVVQALEHDTEYNSSEPATSSTFAQWNLTSDQREQIHREIGDGWEALFTSFNMMFMEGLDLELLDYAFSPILAKSLYVYYVVIVPLIMLNMLIALMVREPANCVILTTMLLDFVLT
jgi:hypothetical protein|eukprot:COSAG01_NODE_2335_length_7876_cov_4.657580_2_plen_162_part_00